MPVICSASRVRDDAERLRDILEAVERIERYAIRGREAFERDELIQNWMVHHLLGETTARLSMNGTGVWRTERISLPKAWFTGRQNAQADLRIDPRAPEIYIRRVTLTKR